MLVTARSYDEYAAMFDLDARPPDGLVVDCCAGASSFVAELAERGGTGLAVDPVYSADRARLTTSVHSGAYGAGRILTEHADRFVWRWYGSLERRERMRERAAARFGAEVRVFPLVVQGTGDPVPFLGRLVDELRAGGYGVDLRRVPYEFQRGADRMLRIAR